jgi:hypothetical protein
LFQKRIYSIFRGTLEGKRKQTIFKKRWFDITMSYTPVFPTKAPILNLCVKIHNDDIYMAFLIIYIGHFKDGTPRLCSNLILH